MTESEPSEKRISDQQIQSVSMMVLAGVAGIYMVYWLRPVLVPFIVACFIVSGVGPILTYLENRFRVSRLVAAGMAFLLGVALMGIFGLTITFSIIDLAKNKDNYQKRVRQLVDMVDSRMSFDGLKLSALKPGKRSDASADNQSTEGIEENVALEPASDATAIEPSVTGTIADERETEPDGASAESTGSDITEIDRSDLENRSVEGDGSGETADTKGSDSSLENPPVTSLSETSLPNDSPPITAQPLPATSQSRPVESDRMKEATELVDAFVRDGISVVLQTFLNMVSTSIVVLIYVFFLLLGKPAYAKTGTMKEIDTQIRGYLSLKTVISIGTGAVFGITLRLFGVPMALSFGVLAFLLNFIPNIGPIVASLLPIPLILLDPSGNIVWMIAVIAATSTIQLISGNVVEPKLMGNSSDLHPVTILLGLMFWGMMWGIIGMFLATPVTAAMKIVLERFEPTKQIANIMAGRWEAKDEWVKDEEVVSSV